MMTTAPQPKKTPAVKAGVFNQLLLLERESQTHISAPAFRLARQTKDRQT